MGVMERPVSTQKNSKTDRRGQPSTQYEFSDMGVIR